MVYFNHLNWNYCKSDLLISEKRLDVLIDARAGFWIHFWADVQRLRYDVFSMHRVNFVMRWPKLSTLKKCIQIARSQFGFPVFIYLLFTFEVEMIWSCEAECTIVCIAMIVKFFGFYNTINSLRGSWRRIEPLRCRTRLAWHYLAKLLIIFLICNKHFFQLYFSSNITLNHSE